MGFFTAFTQGMLNRREEIRDAEAEKRDAREKFIRDALLQAAPELQKYRNAASEVNRRYNEAVGLGIDPMRASLYANDSKLSVDDLMKYGVRSRSTGKELDKETLAALKPTTMAMSNMDTATAGQGDLQADQGSLMDNVLGRGPATENDMFNRIGADMNTTGGAVKALFGGIMSGNYGITPMQMPGSTDTEIYKKTTFDELAKTIEAVNTNNYLTADKRAKAQELVLKALDGDRDALVEFHKLGLGFAEEEALKNQGKGTENEPKPPYTNDKQAAEFMHAIIAQTIDPEVQIYKDPKTDETIIKSLDPKKGQQINAAVNRALREAADLAEANGLPYIYYVPAQELSDIANAIANEIGSPDSIVGDKGGGTKKPEPKPELSAKDKEAEYKKRRNQIGK